MKIYSYKTGEISTFEKNEKIMLNDYSYLLENNGFEYTTNRLYFLIEKEVKEHELIAPSVKKVLDFAKSNKCEVRVFEKKLNGLSFKILAYYINNMLKEVSVYRNGAFLINYANNPKEQGKIEAIKKQLQIEF